MTQAPFINSYNRLSIKGFDLLVELALNLRWSWSHCSDHIWRLLDAMLWELTHNPWVIIQTVSKERLEMMLADPEFRILLDDQIQLCRTEIKSDGWFQNKYPHKPLTCVAYFSMEYMLTDALPIYSGGLGNVAGDQLKAASDLGVPVVGIGLLYQQGYFRQMIDKNGMQQALYPFNDPGQLPITPLRKANGEWLRLEISLPGYSVWLRTWQVQVGKLRLFLLDSNDAANFPPHRALVSELYGGGLDLRIKQEIILGIGGGRLLEELGLKPDVCHLNEGHAAFLILERAYQFMKATGASFDLALNATRVGNLFTTHTAVPAGFDRFPSSMIEQYLGNYAKSKLGIDTHSLLALGRQNPNDESEPFNMAYLAIRGSGAVNGVSKLHETVSKDILSPLFPRWPKKEIPITHVTNGVHMPTWDSEESDKLWEGACSKCRWLGEVDVLEKAVRRIPDSAIWKMRNEARGGLIHYVRNRYARQLAVAGASLEEIETASKCFDHHSLLIGFARRFATYKRPNMLLKDPERLLRIINNPKSPVQLIIAGKAHPEDQFGQALIKEWSDFIKRPEAKGRVVFLSDYDLFLSEQLVRGIDLWVNTPRRPWEACGTSGMKVLVNGGLNLSELDGWWAEAYDPSVGWALGDVREHGFDPSWDAHEADQLYTLLENEIIPTFYERDADGMPPLWLNKIRESMATLTPQFSASRAVQDYVEKHYIPLATQYMQRTVNDAEVAKKVSEWRKEIAQKWPSLHFKNVKVETKNNQHQFEAEIEWNGLNPGMVKVELYADQLDKPYEMQRIEQSTSDQKSWIYRAAIPTTLPAEAFTMRIIPYSPHASVPLETGQILWQR